LDPDAGDVQWEVRRNGGGTGSTRFYRGIGTNSDRRTWQNGGGSQARIMQAERPGGWVVEMAIPWADLGGITGQGEILGIAFLNFSSSGGVGWATKPDTAIVDNASSWADAYLGGCVPTAAFTAAAACAGVPMTFTDASLNGPTLVEWDFGDGTP